MKYCPVCEFDLRGVTTHCAICNHRVVEHCIARIKGFPNEYIAIDIEYSDNTIVEVAAVHMRDGSKIEEFQSLVRPGQTELENLNPFAMRVSGINRKMLENAPLAKDVLPHFISLVCSGHPILGHNVKGDISRTLSKCPEPKRVIYVDTLFLANVMIPEIPNRKLETLAAVLDIEECMKHRAMTDTLLAIDCYEEMKRLGDGKATDISQYVSLCRTPSKEKLSEMKPKGQPFTCDEHPLFNSFCVVSGEFGLLSRMEAQQAIVCHGGNVRAGISGKTTHLIVGCNPGCSKLADVKRRRENGQHIEVVNEDIFMEMLEIDSSKFNLHLAKGKCATCLEDCNWACR